jgi:hypothetical protein
MQELNSQLINNMIKQVIIRYVVFSLIGFVLGAISMSIYINSTKEPLEVCQAESAPENVQ